MIVPALPPFGRAAFLLDVDGTLLDIAPTPDAVVVAPGLAGDLVRLRKLCGGALAFVTGRPVVQVDALFPGVAHAVAGEHGAALRSSPEAAIRVTDLPQPPADWVDAAKNLAARHHGVGFEPKGHGFVLHYRGAPEAGAELHDVLQAMIEARPGQFVLMAAKMAWEVRPAGVDKGMAVQALMREAPFAGRLPVFVGDDVTDEDGIRVARALGGVGLFVPDEFGDAAGVRGWIAGLVA